MIKIGIVGGTGTPASSCCASSRSIREADAARRSRRARRPACRSPTCFPVLRGSRRSRVQRHGDADLTRCDVVFFATPHGVAMAEARELVDAGVQASSTSPPTSGSGPGDVRAAGTRCRTRVPTCWPKRSYGLARDEPRRDPQRAHRRQSRAAIRPRCSSASLPLVEAGIVDAMHLIADCKSGVSGAGRKAELGTAVRRGVRQLQGVRRRPAIGIIRRSSQKLQRLQRASRSSCVFTPHLVPMIRGMHATLYARLKPTSPASTCRRCTRSAIADEPFVDVMPPGSMPDTRSMRASNMLRHRGPPSARAATIAVVLLVVQDNLVKGAAGRRCRA